MGGSRKQENRLGIEKGNFTISFNICINTPKSCVWVGYFKRTRKKELTGALVDGKKKKIRVYCNKAHELLGHAGGEDRIKYTTKALGMELKRGRMYKCEPCVVGKAKQKSIPHTTDLSNETKVILIDDRLHSNVPC